MTDKMEPGIELVAKWLYEKYCPVKDLPVWGNRTEIYKDVWRKEASAFLDQRYPCQECGGEGRGLPTLGEPDGHEGGCLVCHGTGKGEKILFTKEDIKAGQVAERERIIALLYEYYVGEAHRLCRFEIPRKIWDALKKEG